MGSRKYSPFATSSGSIGPIPPTGGLGSTIPNDLAPRTTSCGVRVLESSGFQIREL